MIESSSIIFSYCLLGPIIAAFVVALYLFPQKQIIVNFPKVLLSGKTDRLGTSIDIQGDGMLAVYGTQLPPNKRIVILGIDV